MDPVMLAATVVRLVVPYLRQLGEKATEKSADATADAALSVGRRLYESLKSRFRTSSYANSQLSGVEERPDSEVRQAALQGSLVELLEQDQEFRQSLQRMVNEAVSAGTTQMTAYDSGAVAGGDVKIRGQYAAGRDISFGQSAPGQSASPGASKD